MEKYIKAFGERLLMGVLDVTVDIIINRVYEPTIQMVVDLFMPSEVISADDERHESIH